jgi:MOSC domain-containing protein YiiM
MDLRILSVNIARARVIGTHDGHAVLSGIDKKAVAGEVVVRTLGIAGDEQADLRVHGGVDKAVYAYPSEHWEWWMREKSVACRAAAFGENLTLEGALEGDVAIGDRFRWGEALLEISQPRAPCYKLAMHTGRLDTPQAMTVSARCGWYLRVVEEGRASSRALERVHASGGPSVREAFRAVFAQADWRHVDEAKLSRVHDAPALAESWRRPLARKIAALHAGQAQSR